MNNIPKTKFLRLREHFVKGIFEKKLAKTWKSQGTFVNICLVCSSRNTSGKKAFPNSDQFSTYDNEKYIRTLQGKISGNLRKETFSNSVEALPYCCKKYSRKILQFVR